jgi:hypothetical protein
LAEKAEWAAVPWGNLPPDVFEITGDL